MPTVSQEEKSIVLLMPIYIGLMCIFREIWVNPESDQENIAYPNLLTVKCPFRVLDITRLQKST